ncbi:PPE domain-containing protein [Nocardia flavorosea]|uniref:PPE domain-containing protein n=1 Tax=Nocardia flavorosea TaxID=53429 RepID=A0A846YL10_9NOCA|nr:PPE domain-containing protein [Nocardia flavorosea]NKY59817.1 PPE domain-containing protein [Nocardia flavorosea]
MALNVDLGELVTVAGRAAEMARTTGAALPREWVLPAGADPISAEAVPRLNAQAAGLFNGVINVLNEVQKLSHNVGAAAVDYAATDAESARTLAGLGGGHDVTNPVPEVEQLGYRRVPEPLSSMTSTTGDPLVFAQQLHSGPGPEPARRFADSVRAFNADTVITARGDMDSAASALQHWTPVGSGVAEKLTKYRGWLDEIGTGLTLLADSAATYGDSFATAKAKHPTPEEIIAARKELARSMRAKDEIGVQAALAKFQEHNTRSAETVGAYAAETGASGAADGSAAGQGGAADSSGLAQMLPALMSMMGAGMNGLPLTEEVSDDYYDDYYDDYGVGDYGVPSLGPPGGSSPSVGVPSPADVESQAVGVMPVSAGIGMGTGAGLGSAPRVPVMESASPSSSSNSPYGRSGMPYMPMMPMAPGAGGAGGGGNERNRVVAWHPDRLMYVDDTPHTEQVIGERPTIAPTVTSPTPPPPNQAPARSGGTA